MASNNGSFKLVPVLALYFLAPLIGELLSGSAPPPEFFSIVGLIVLPALYGAGAVIVRELAVSWKKGWGTIWILGAAYGVIEEGIMVRSWFDPNWMDLGILGTYGRWLGVNWIWAYMLTLYHASISISIPILLLDLIWPELKGVRITGKWSFRAIALVFVLDVLLGFVLFRYGAPFHLILFASAISAFLIWLSKRWPADATSGPNLMHPLAYFVVGFTSMVFFFVIEGGLPQLIPWSIVTLGIGVLYALAIRWFLKRSLIGSGDESRAFWLATGVLGFFIFLTPFQESNPNRTDNPAGMILVGLSFFLFLVFVYLRLRSRRRKQLPPPPNALGQRATIPSDIVLTPREADFLGLHSIACVCRDSVASAKI